MAQDSAGVREAGAFGPNAWLVEEMYEEYLADPASVSESWREFFADYRSAGQPGSLETRPGGTRSKLAVGAPGLGSAHRGAGEANGSAGAGLVDHGADHSAGHSAGATPGTLTDPVAPAAPGPNGVGANGTGSGADRAQGLDGTHAPTEGARLLRGASARIVENMVASLGVPTATSVHPVPAKLLEVNRQILNEHLARTKGGKVSFTHLIGWAVVRALQAVPALNRSYVEDADGRGTPGVIEHPHVGLGIAIDIERPGGTRSLLVPCIAAAESLDFAGFVHNYEDLVRKVRSAKVAVEDFAGVTVTLTNPGTLGTTQSVPRLMPGQGAIIGVGALGFPAELGSADESVLADLGISKVVTLTSTYDHRVIQGAESGLFLSYVHDLLIGEHGFYDEVFAALAVPHQPARWHRDVNPVGRRGADGELAKQAHVQSLINMYRVRGHLIANLDPLGTTAPELHPELDPLTFGLTIFDLDRSFVTDGLAGEPVLRLGEIIEILRDAYCRTIGVEYMHIQDPEQKRWIQAQIEGRSSALSSEEQWHILERLNAAEAFERFLHTRYIGQKRFGLEGAEAAIAFLDAVLEAAIGAGMSEAVLGMAHRGRLNVLANIVGKSYAEIFAEFEGNLDPESVQGSGDVKYHKGASGSFVDRHGVELPVALASNPSHLEAVDPVVEGMVRAKQDQLADPADFPVLPILVHGDAAFAGQGVVAETLNLSQLRGYRTGGTIHLVINNQLGFTTQVADARSSVYCTDVAKMVQAPIFHVNGDDPEACVRVGRLALAYRQAFHRDVVVDLLCYRLHGHNEGDDPSYTQPLMYRAIDEHRSVRKIYTEALVKRGDITIERAEAALEDFQSRLQSALDETRSSAPPRIDHLPQHGSPVLSPLSGTTGVDRTVLDELARLLHSAPEGFTVHPKLWRQLETRAKLYASGEVDWALAEALGFGSLLLEGTDVRLAGQDTRRGTFSQRHSVLVDYANGVEYVPLGALGAGEGRGRFLVYDSLLSEYAALGFEYGYSVEAPQALVAWEAQFGDFGNGGQIVVDNFLAAAGEKWDQHSGLVLLLPHGYEGQGPEHSSARLERYLQLCAAGNMTVAQPTTAAQYFHLLRAQARRSVRRPLVVMTPKSLLRSREARSPTAELVEGSFREVLDDPERGRALDPAAVSTVVLCSGKIAYEALARRGELFEASGQAGTAIVRIEQLYPFPEREIATVLAGYPAAEKVVFLQDEPENMGAWTFAHARLLELLGSRYSLDHVSRAESGSPATGSHMLHELETEDLLARAVGTVTLASLR